MAGEPGLTQTGPQTAACILLVWTAPLKGPASLFHSAEPRGVQQEEQGWEARCWAVALAGSQSALWP